MSQLRGRCRREYGIERPLGGLQADDPHADRLEISLADGGAVQPGAVRQFGKAGILQLCTEGDVRSLAIARSILANRSIQLRYRVDGGRVRSARAHTIIVGNCGTLTGSMLLLPAAKVDDGVLDVVMLRPKGRFGWARIGTRLAVQGVAQRSRFGRAMLVLAPDLQALAYAQGWGFDVRFEVPHRMQLDGDSFGTIVAARITVRPAASGAGNW